jgi:general secretion pathway protein J
MRRGTTYRAISGKQREAGFTLVELLMAMTLLAFLSIALFGGLRFGARSWEVVADSSEERDRIASTQTFLRERLGNVSKPGSARPGRASAAGQLGGEPDRVEFDAPWLSALSLGGLYRFALWYEFEEAGDGRLMLSWRPAEADPDTLEELGDLAGERVLLDGIAEFSLSYFGAPDEREEPEWFEMWERGNAQPRLVRIQLAFDDARRVWPDFVVATKF